MEHSPSSEANNSPASQEIPMHVIRTDHQRLCTVPDQSNHTLPSYFYTIHFNIILSTPTPSKRLRSFVLTHPNPVCIYLISHTCYMPLPSHYPWLNNTRRQVQIIKHLTIQFSPPSRSPPPPFIHPQSIFFRRCKRRSFKPIQNNGRNIVKHAPEFHMTGHMIDWLIDISVKTLMIFLTHERKNCDKIGI
jgi:hypothetical protein